jgi:hypothetical protein
MIHWPSLGPQGGSKDPVEKFGLSRPWPSSAVQNALARSSPTHQNALARSSPTHQNTLARSSPTHQNALARSSPTHQNALARSSPTHPSPHPTACRLIFATSGVKTLIPWPSTRSPLRPHASARRFERQPHISDPQARRARCRSLCTQRLPGNFVLSNSTARCPTIQRKRCMAQSIPPPYIAIAGNVQV